MIIQKAHSIPFIDKLLNVEQNESWMTLIISFLQQRTLLNDKKEAKNVECLMAYFFLENRLLYKKSLALPSLRCLCLNKAKYVPWEIHEGICSNHLVGITITLKVIWVRYL